MRTKEEEYNELFIGEALENFEEMNRCLTTLEKDPTNKGLINSLFRITHTLKGNAYGMGHEHIASLTHVLEDFFGEVRSGNFAIAPENFNDLFKALDCIGKLVNSLKTGDKVNFKGIKTKIEVLIKNKLTENSKNQEITNDSLVEKTETIESIVEDSSVNDVVTLDLAEDEELIIEESETKSVSEISFSDLVQVPVRKLDNLLNLVGELVIERDRLAVQAGNHFRSNEFSRLNRISSDLQYSVMDVRLVQVGFLFNKFHRLIRDAANIENKKVELKLEGTETEIDRNILQIISDSLIHILRNAVGHGIETPEERKKLKKSEVGVITLSSQSQSDTVIVKIQDDGRGIDVERVKQKAIKQDLITKEWADSRTKDELIQLIFEPGFSSVDVVNQISGRGVGMDVVKRAIESIGGNVEVTTEQGYGSCITLHLPSSMAVKGTLLFELDAQQYAIPLNYTESVSSVYKSGIHVVGDDLVTTYQGKTIPLIILKDFLNHFNESLVSNQRASLEQLPNNQKLDTVIVSFNNKRLAILVDKLLQQKEIVEKSLSKPIDKLRTVSGVTILGDGKVCLVINIPAVVNLYFQQTLVSKNSKQLAV